MKTVNTIIHVYLQLLGVWQLLLQQPNQLVGSLQRHIWYLSTLCLQQFTDGFNTFYPNPLQFVEVAMSVQ